MARPEVDRPTELTLTPVLNLVILLIPLLLMAQAAPLAVLDTTLPAICSTGCGEAEEVLQPKLSLTGAGITVTGHQGLLGEDQVVLPCAGACVEAGDFDFAALTRVLGELKDRSPDTSEVLLGASDDVPYEALVSLMDTARESDFPDMTVTGSPL